eukprot:173856-Hanusia_phi.AAC.1
MNGVRQQLLRRRQQVKLPVVHLLAQRGPLPPPLSRLGRILLSLAMSFPPSDVSLLSSPSYLLVSCLCRFSPLTCSPCAPEEAARLKAEAAAKKKAEAAAKKAEQAAKKAEAKKQG